MVKDRITITEPKLINYVAELISIDITIIEASLKARQTLLQEFKDYKGT